MEKKEKTRIRLFGLTLLVVGIFIVTYGVFFGRSDFAFWPMYIGFTLIVTGLGILGVNVSGYPF